jgi:hypothetical protein
MALKAAFVRLKPKHVPVEITGFFIALAAGIFINYLLDDVLIDLNTLTFGLVGAILARLWAAKAGWPRRPHDAVTAGEQHPPVGPIDDLLSQAQLRKLNLEIDDLGRRTQWERRVARYVPPVTVAIGVISLLVGLYQFRTQQWTQHEQDLREREKDRIARALERRISFQNQIRADLDRLLQFAPDEKQTVSTASFLLLDIKTILGSKVDEKQTMMEIFCDYERNVTVNLVTGIKYDCDFSRSARDVRFATAVFDNWDDYQTYLRSDLDSLERLLYMYIRAIRRLHDDNPGYFQDMEYDDKTGGYRVSKSFEKQADEEHRFQHFLAIAKGFTKHVQLLDENCDEAKTLKDLVLKNFQSALCNQSVSTGILKTYFPDQECD